MKMVEINNVAIYCSKPSKCEIPLTEQKEKLKKYCKHFGLNIVKEYVAEYENDLFYQLLNDIKNKEFNIVLTYSFDTLTKSDDELINLLMELERYHCELHIESLHRYCRVTKTLFKIPRREEETTTVKKKKSGVIPILESYKVKNPIMTEPVDWVKKLEPDNFWFEEEEIFDSNGEYLGKKRDLYLIVKKIKGCIKPKKKKQLEEEKKYKLRKLW